MSEYRIAGDDDSLFPEEPNEYAVVVTDQMKPIDSDDYIFVLSEFENDDFKLPSRKEHMTYYVHTADGEVMTHDDWESEE